MPEHNPEALKTFAGKVSNSVTGGLNCALTMIGGQLGLYRSLADNGPMQSSELAEATQLSERWVREWLYQQACIGQIEYDESANSFFLTSEGKAVLADENHPAYLGGMIQSVVAMYDSVEHLPECFRSGLGQSFDDKGEGCACGIEKMSRKFQTDYLVPALLPRLDGIMERLTAGAKGKVSALALDGGRVLTEYPVVLQYIADQAAPGELIPGHGQDERYEVVSWLSFVTSEIHKMGLYPLAAATAPEEMKAFTNELLSKQLSLVNEVLSQREYIAGSFSVADAYLFWALTLLPKLGYTLPEELKYLATYQNRVGQREAFQKALREESALAAVQL